jgi:REP element-mobilizing transposase RayT
MKYRREVLSPKVVRILLQTCKKIEERYEITFLEIGADGDHIHFLVQSVPMYSVTKIVRTIKSLTAKEIFKHAPGVKRALWGGEFWSNVYYVNTVSRQESQQVISTYVRKQGKTDYEKLYENNQLDLFR